MKIVLIILSAIICFLLLLLFLPLTVNLVYEHELMLKIKYVGITLFDNKKRKALKKSKAVKANAENTAPQKKDSFIKKTYKQKGLFGTVNYFCDILSIVLKKLGRVVKRFKFRSFKLNLTVATDDAAETAIQYGRMCAAVYPILSLLQTTTDFKFKEVNISADFNKTKGHFKTSILVKSQPFYWLIAAILILVQFLKLQRKECEKYERKQFENRNGYNNGKALHNG